MKNILLDCHMRSILLAAVCVPLWGGGLCYAFGVNGGEMKLSAKENLSYEVRQDQGIRITGTITDRKSVV